METIDYDVMKSRKLLILINHAAGKKCWKMSLGHEDEWYFLKGDRKYVPELRICLFYLVFLSWPSQIDSDSAEGKYKYSSR